MSTTHSPAAQPVPNNGVTPIDPMRRRRHLERLLDTRSALAALAAERRSHNLDDAGETFGLLLSVEAELQHEFPDVHEARFPHWVTQDAVLEHPAGTLSPDCGICRTLAVSRQINLTPPEAA